MAVGVALSVLAPLIGANWAGSRDLCITHVAALDSAGPDALAFFAAARYRKALRMTKAGAVVLAPDAVGECPSACLVTGNPSLGFARASSLLHPRKAAVSGIHPSAVVAKGAAIEPSASIGANCVIDEGVSVGAGVEIGPGCVLQAGVAIGYDSRLAASVTLCAGTIVGERVMIHPGAVIGRDGFGFAKDGDKWVRVPQIGRVRIGNDVEIGSNTVVDRATLGETVIADGVKIDNLVQIGHNVVVGRNTAIAACSGISGSTRVGDNCTVAGAVGMAGHLVIGDNVHFTGMAMVTRSIDRAGVYSSGIPATGNSEWRRNVARFRHLDDLWRRVQQLERIFVRRAGEKCGG